MMPLAISVIMITIVGGGIINTSVPLKEHNATLIKNVHIIPMTKEKVIKGQTVLLKGREILDIAPTAELSIPRDTKIIDGGGGYLIPGLADMHAHILPEWPIPHLNLYLANGLTTIRILYGAPYMLEWKKEIEDGKRLGPALYVSCPIIFGDEPNVAQLAEDAAKSNYDCMKLYSFLKKEDFNNALKVADAHGLYTVAHVPFNVGVEGVLEAGLKEIAHIDEIAFFIGNPDTTLNLAPQELYAYILSTFEKTYPGCFEDPIETFKERIMGRVTELVKKIKASHKIAKKNRRWTETILKNYGPAIFLCRVSKYFIDTHRAMILRFLLMIATISAPFFLQISPTNR